MLLKNRNRFLSIFFVFFAPSIALYLFALIFFVTSTADNLPLIFSFKLKFIFNLISQGFFLLTTIVSSSFIFWNFRKTSSNEIFYFIAFLTLSSILASQSIMPILVELNAPLPIQNAGAKFIFFGTLICFFTLLLIQLFNFGFEFNYSEILLFAMLLIVFVFISLISFDQTIYQKALQSTRNVIPSVFISRTEVQPNIFLFVFILCLCINVLSSVIATIKNEEWSYLIFGGCVALCLFITFAISQQLHFIVQFIAALLFPITITIFSVYCHRLYKWS